MEPVSCQDLGDSWRWGEGAERMGGSWDRGKPLEVTRGDTKRGTDHWWQ